MDKDTIDDLFNQGESNEQQTNLPSNFSSNSD